jgi:hypothetical protein
MVELRRSERGRSLSSSPDALRLFSHRRAGRLSRGDGLRRQIRLADDDRSRQRVLLGGDPAPPRGAPPRRPPAALVWARHPVDSVAQVRDAILGGVDPLPTLTGKVATGGRLNIARAVAP